MKLLKIMPEMVLKKFSGSSIYRPKCSVSNLLIIQLKMSTHNYCIILLSQSVYFAIMLQAEAKASGDVMTQVLPLQLGCFRSSSSIRIHSMFKLCLVSFSSSNYHARNCSISLSKWLRSSSKTLILQIQFHQLSF